MSFNLGHLTAAGARGRVAWGQRASLLVPGGESPGFGIAQSRTVRSALPERARAVCRQGDARDAARMAIEAI